MEFEKDILNCLEVLQKGGIILYPTDTIWGIGCDATNAKAVERIYGLKKRPGEKTMIVLVADEKDIFKYVDHPDPGILDHLRKTSKPTTVVYEKAKGLAKNLMAEDGSIAIRICKDDFCKELIRRFGKPIVSTSANISEQPSPKNFSVISDEIKNGVDYIVRYRQDDPSDAASSSIVKWNQDGTITILRE